MLRNIREAGCFLAIRGTSEPEFYMAVHRSNHAPDLLRFLFYDVPGVWSFKAC